MMSRFTIGLSLLSLTIIQIRLSGTEIIIVSTAVISISYSLVFQPVSRRRINVHACNRGNPASVKLVDNKSTYCKADLLSKNMVGPPMHTATDTCFTNILGKQQKISLVPLREQTGKYMTRSC
jgi:hypothetical protein